MVSNSERKLFDEILEDVIDALPDHLHALLEEVPVVVEDRPSRKLLREMELDPDEDDLCGLHSGVALTERSVEHSGNLPDQITLFRNAIIEMSGLRDLPEHGEVPFSTFVQAEKDAEAELEKQIRVTLLHEMGHHFGLDEDDLESLGYG